MQFVTKMIYDADHEYKFRRWLDLKQYSADYFDITNDAEGELFGEIKFNTIKENSGDGAIDGNVYEKTIDTTYNANIILSRVDTGDFVAKTLTNNGSFNFKNLNVNLKYKVTAIDETFKYDGKVIDNIEPYLDLTTDSKIYLLNQTPIITLEYTAYFKIKVLGEPQISINNKPSWMTLTKISDDIYKVSGIPTTYVDIDYTFVVDDYREDSSVNHVELRVQNKNQSILKYKFTNTLMDSSTKYEAVKVGNPTLTPTAVKIDGKANSININKNPMTELGYDNFTIYFDFTMVAFKNPSVVGNKYLCCSNGSTNDPYQMHILLTNNKYIKIANRNEGNSTWVGADYTTVDAEVNVGNRYMFKIVQENRQVRLYLNNKLLGVQDATDRKFDIGANGFLMFGSNGYDANADRETQIDVHEFTIIKGYAQY